MEILKRGLGRTEDVDWLNEKKTRRLTHLYFVATRPELSSILMSHFYFVQKKSELKIIRRQNSSPLLLIFVSQSWCIIQQPRYILFISSTNLCIPGPRTASTLLCITFRNSTFVLNKRYQTGWSTESSPGCQRWKVIIKTISLFYWQVWMISSWSAIRITGYCGIGFLTTLCHSCTL